MDYIHPLLNHMFRAISIQIHRPKPPCRTKTLPATTAPSGIQSKAECTASKTWAVDPNGNLLELGNLT